MSENGSVEVAIQDGIGTVTFFHPKSNSLPGPLLRKIAETITQCGDDEAIKVIVLKSAGDRAFCAGADLSEGAKTFDYEARADTGEVGRTNKIDIQRDGGGRVRGRERHAAFRGGLGRACTGYGAGDPGVDALGFRIDRATGHRICGNSIFPLGAKRAARRWS